MVPAIVGPDIVVSPNEADDAFGGEKEIDYLEGQTVDKVNLYSDLDSDDSISEFEWNLRVLMLNFQSGLEAITVDSVQGTRKSGRLKKPS